MNLEVKDVLQGLTLLANLWMFFYLRRLENKKADESTISSLKKSVEGHGERITVLESTQRAAVSKQDVADLHNRITKLSEEFHELAGLTKASVHTLGLIQAWLTSNKGD